MHWYDWLGVLGNVGSLVGLVITLVVLKNVRKLRSRYVKQAILTECLGKLKAHRTNLASAITRSNLSSIRRHLGKIKAVRERIELHEDEGAGIRWTAKEIEAVRKVSDAGLLGEAERVLAALDEWIERIELTVAEMAWGKDDE